jgi:kynurenine formamidase
MATDMGQAIALDISVPVFPGMLHPGRQPEPRRVESIANGDPGNVTRWYMGAHTGTHLEAPLHANPAGTAIDGVPLDVLVGRAQVLDLRDVETEITADDLLAAGLRGDTRVLLRTSNSDRALRTTERPSSWVGLAPDAARLVAERGVKLVGIDFYTVESPLRDASFESHHILAGAGIATLEHVDLAAVQPGVYELVCLPIPLTDAEAAPARAVLMPLREGTVAREPHDVSVAVNEQMLHWGKPPVREVVQAFEHGDRCNVTRWDIGSHTGLHVDAGLHFDEAGAPIDELPLEVLIGPARVLDLTAIETEITAADLEAAGLGEEARVLLKTRNSTTALKEREKPAFWIGLAPDGAQLLVDRGVRLVSIDFLTIDSPSRDTTWDTHRILCPAGVAIVECCDLTGIERGVYELICLPVKLRGSEAAPGGAFLRSLPDGIA